MNVDYVTTASEGQMCIKIREKKTVHNITKMTANDTEMRES